MRRRSDCLRRKKWKADEGHSSAAGSREIRCRSAPNRTSRDRPVIVTCSALHSTLPTKDARILPPQAGGIGSVLHPATTPDYRRPGAEAEGTPCWEPLVIVYQ